MTQRPVPTAIALFGGLMVLVGLAAGVAQYLAPTATFAGLPDPPSLPILNVAWQVGSRSVAQAVALALALWLRDPRVLGAMFVMRAVTEIQDLVITLRVGAPAPPVLFAAAFVVLFIGPELACAWVLLRRRRAEQPIVTPGALA